MDVRYLDTTEALRQWLAELADAPWVAMDTEFVRERTYYPRLCLIQLATRDRVACIDPLAVPDLSPLAPILTAPNVTKVFHAAAQDVEILYQTFGCIPAPVFDTQMAAALLGYGDQCGLEGLVRTVCDVRLDKSETRSDWCQRPLSNAQLHYAVADVQYLALLYEHLSSALADAGRLDWLTADFAALSDPATVDVRDDRVWRQVKGSANLKPRELAVLQALAAWREAEARSQDRPRRWIVDDEALITLARQQPRVPAELGRVRSLRKDHRQRYGDALLQAVAIGLAVPESDWPAPTAGRKLSPEEEPLVDAVLALVKSTAQQHGIASTVLATRKEVERVVAGATDRPLLQGWRRALVGEAVSEFLAGRVALRRTPVGLVWDAE